MTETNLNGPWVIFNTQTDCQAYADAESALLPQADGDVTQAWDVPRQLADGRWVTTCMRDDGIPWQEDWTWPEPDLVGLLP